METRDFRCTNHQFGNTDNAVIISAWYIRSRLRCVCKFTENKIRKNAVPDVNWSRGEFRWRLAFLPRGWWWWWVDGSHTGTDAVRFPATNLRGKASQQLPGLFSRTLRDLLFTITFCRDTKSSVAWTNPLHWCDERGNWHGDNTAMTATSRDNS